MRLAGVALVVVFTCGCYCTARIVQPTGPPSTSASVRPPGHDIVALLQDPETRKVGRAIVSSPLGWSVELKDERTAIRTVIGQPPSVTFKFSEAQVQQLLCGIVDRFIIFQVVVIFVFVFVHSSGGIGRIKGVYDSESGLTSQRGC